MSRYYDIMIPVIAARGGRSGVRECTRSCLALLLPSLSLLLLPSSPSPTSLSFVFHLKKKHVHSFLAFHISQTFCTNLLQFAIYFCSEDRLFIFCSKSWIFQDPSDTEIRTFSLKNNDCTNVSRAAQ